MARPAAAIVFGILNIAFSALGLCGLAFAIPVLFIQASGNPVLELQNQYPGYQLWTYFSTALAVPMTLVQLAGGIGLVKMRTWGRSMSMWYAGISVLMALVGIGLHSVYMLVPLFQGSLQTDNPAEQAGLIGGAIGGLVGGVFSIIYAGLMMYFLSRPHVVAAFAGTWLPQGILPGGEPVMPPVPAAPVSSNPYVSPVPTPEYYAGPAAASAGTGDDALTTIIPVRNPAALAGYYLGVFGLIPCVGLPLAIAAIVCGIFGLRAVKNLPASKGKAHAWAGIILGSVVTLLSIAFVILLGVAASR